MTRYRRFRLHPSTVRRFLEPLADVFGERSDRTTWARVKETRATAEGYLVALLSPGTRKNMEGLADRVGLPEDRVERFVRESPWDFAALQKHLMAHVPKAIQSPRGVLVVDDVALVKQGHHSVAVSAQYAGAVGKVANCQVGVDLILVTPNRRRNADQKTWPLGMRLYVPQAWIEAPEFADERVRVRLPKGLAFKTKPAIALEMIDDARREGVLHELVTADAGYGESAEFRAALRARNEPYVMGVSPTRLRVIDESVSLVPPGPSVALGAPRAHWTFPLGTRVRGPREIARAVKKWTEVRWSEGTKGELRGNFHCLRVRVVERSTKMRWATDEVGFLLLENRPNELKAYLCWGVDGASIERLVSWLHARWPIEQFHREAKQDLGLDRFEGRTWQGWHHHVSMVLLAYAFVARLRAERGGKRRLPSFPKVLRLIVSETATQQLVNERGLPRKEAREIAESMLRRYSDWW